jgi:hypothetical protein
VTVKGSFCTTEEKGLPHLISSQETTGRVAKLGAWRLATLHLPRCALKPGAGLCIETGAKYRKTIEKTQKLCIEACNKSPKQASERFSYFSQAKNSFDFCFDQKS